MVYMLLNTGVDKSQKNNDLIVEAAGVHILELCVKQLTFSLVSVLNQGGYSDFSHIAHTGT